MSGLINEVDKISKLARVRPWSVTDPTFQGVFKSRLEQGQPVYLNVTGEREGVLYSGDYLLRSLDDWQILQSKCERWLNFRFQFMLDVTWLCGVASPELLEPFWDSEQDLFCGILGSPTKLFMPDGGAYGWLNDNVGKMVALVQDPVLYGCIQAYMPDDNGDIVVGNY